MDSAASMFLQANPRYAYASMLPKLGQPMQRYYQPRFNELYDEYTGMLAANPTLQFPDWLNQQNWLQRYQGVPGAMRGNYSSRSLTPATRFLSY